MCSLCDFCVSPTCVASVGNYSMQASSVDILVLGGWVSSVVGHSTVSV